MSLIIGKKGEDYCVKMLKKSKYKIITRNFRSKFGEIDIIAKKNDTVIFIEVKTRDKNSWHHPAEAVDYYKRKKIISTAKYYQMLSKTQENYRFDVCCVITDNGKVIEYSHIENAFYENARF